MFAASTVSANDDTHYQITSQDGSLRDEVKKNVMLYLDDFSTPDTDNLAYWEKLVKRHVNQALQALGYYSSKVVLSFNNSGAKPQVTIDIAMGYPIVILKSQYQVVGAGKSFPPFMAQRNSYPLVVGSKLDHGSYQTVKTAMMDIARVYGFFDAKWVKHEIAVDLETQSATIQLIFDTGSRYTFGKISIAKEHASNDIIYAMAPFKEGENFTSTAITNYNIALNQSRYFTSVQAIPELPDTLQKQINIIVTAVNRPRNVVEISAGFTSELGERGRLKWVKPWINRYGHSLESEIKLNKQEQSVTNNYKVPHGDPNLDYTNYVLGWRHTSNFNDTSNRYRKYSLQWQRHQQINEDWKRILLLKYEREKDNTQTVTRTHLIPGFSYVRERRIGGITPNWGDRQFVQVEVSDKAWGSQSSFYKLSMRSNWLRQFNETHQVLLKLDAGYISANDINQVPISMRFFAGGDNNLRAYDFNSISPLDDNNKSRGALTQLLGTIEYSYPVTDKWRLAIFHDVGTIGDKFFKDKYSDAGIGIRWETPVGLIRLDFAKGLKSSDISRFDKPFNISFAIGLDL
ncbi:MAG: autotransporter assembly complex protein TamA [Psychrobium sp.]